MALFELRGLWTVSGVRLEDSRWSNWFADALGGTGKLRLVSLYKWAKRAKMRVIGFFNG